MWCKMSASGINLKKSKKDNADKEMKEYAETAMNELLGWYGYDKMNTGDTQALNLSLFSASTSFSHQTRRPSSRKRSSNSVTAAVAAAGGGAATVGAAPNTSDGSSSSSCSDDSIGGINSNSSVSPARRDGSVSPSPANVCVPAGCVSCGWCHKIGPSKCFTFKMATCNKVFCSEVCFTHYRRANFKRNKTCDWCRHVRHTVSYVDLQDGDSQYQFCSDKCLNQFKLDIFCQETKEHMEMHPHHQEQLQNLEGTSLSTLITPDLWLKNCASPPSSDKSRSSSPLNVSPGSPSSLSSDMKKEFSAGFDEPCVKKKCKKYSNESIKKKKSKKLVTKLRPIQMQKIEEPGVKSSHTHTEPTPPRIPFYPNFSSMLPPNGVPSEFLQRSQYFQPLAGSAVTPARPQTPVVHPRGSLANSQIPPLLPITRSPLVTNVNPTQPPPQPPPPPPQAQVPSTSTSVAPNTPPKSLLPPPTVLVPYPIILPLPIPIPIPIPLPIFLNDAKKATENKTNDNEQAEQEEEPTGQEPEKSPPQSPSPVAVPLPVLTKSNSKKKRKKIGPSEEDASLKHLVENY